MFTDREKKVAGLNVVNDNDMIKNVCWDIVS